MAEVSDNDLQELVDLANEAISHRTETFEEHQLLRRVGRTLDAIRDRSIEKAYRLPQVTRGAPW